MTTLASYIQTTRDYIHDATGAFWTDSQLTSYINRGRQKVVWLTKCYRKLQPFNLVGSVTSISVTSGGHYTSTPTVVFANTYGSGGTASVTMNGTAIASITVISAGSYTQAPAISFTGGGGTVQAVAVATLVMDESLSFTQLPQDLAGNTTIDIMNITIINGQQRMPLNWMVYTQFTAYVRPWTTFVAQPTCFSLYGQNTIYIGPRPDQTYPLEIDSVVMPPDMANTTDVDPILAPYTSPVAYYAASLAYKYQQQTAESEYYTKAFERDIALVMQGVSQRRVFSPFTDRT